MFLRGYNTFESSFANMNNTTSSILWKPLTIWGSSSSVKVTRKKAAATRAYCMHASWQTRHMGGWKANTIIPCVLKLHTDSYVLTAVSVGTRASTHRPLNIDIPVLVMRHDFRLTISSVGVLAGTGVMCLFSYERGNR